MLSQLYGDPVALKKNIFIVWVCGSQYRARVQIPSGHSFQPLDFLTAVIQAIARVDVIAVYFVVLNIATWLAKSIRKGARTEYVSKG